MSSEDVKTTPPPGLDGKGPRHELDRKSLPHDPIPEVPEDLFSRPGPATGIRSLRDAKKIVEEWRRNAMKENGE